VCEYNRLAKVGSGRQRDSVGWDYVVVVVVVLVVVVVNQTLVRDCRQGCRQWFQSLPLQPGRLAQMLTKVNRRPYKGAVAAEAEAQLGQGREQQRRWRQED